MGIIVNITKNEINEKSKKIFAEDGTYTVDHSSPIILLKNGNIDLEVSGMKLCIYEFCCFPCGIDCCNKRTRWCFSSKQEECNRNDYSGIELPEIVGSLKPTKINMTDNNTNDNEYAIYNDNVV